MMMRNWLIRRDRGIKEPHTCGGTNPPAQSRQLESQEEGLGTGNASKESLDPAQTIDA